MTQDPDQIHGVEPTLEIVDEAANLIRDEAVAREVEEIEKMSNLLDKIKKQPKLKRVITAAGPVTHGSPKVNDKQKNRAKAKKARASRKANRG